MKLEWNWRIMVGAAGIMLGIAAFVSLIGFAVQTGKYFDMKSERDALRERVTKLEDLLPKVKVYVPEKEWSEGYEKIVACTLYVHALPMQTVPDYDSGHTTIGYYDLLRSLGIKTWIDEYFDTTQGADNEGSTHSQRGRP